MTGETPLFRQASENLEFQSPVEMRTSNPSLAMTESDTSSEEQTMKARAKAIAYWAATGMIVFAMFSGGVAELTHRPETINGMKELGYPVYFIMIIGFWKLLGSVALVAPGLPRVKEWAYAGIFFNMTGAAVSHVVNHSAGWHVGVTLSLAAITIASWALRPASRTLVASRPAAASIDGLTPLLDPLSPLVGPGPLLRRPLRQTA